MRNLVLDTNTKLKDAIVVTSDAMKELVKNFRDFHNNKTLVIVFKSIDK